MRAALCRPTRLVCTRLILKAKPHIGRRMAASTSVCEISAVLDKQQFTEVLKVPALRVPTSKCQALMKSLRGFTLNRPKVRCIVQDGDRKDTRLLLMEDTYREGLSAILKDLVAGLEPVEYSLSLDYSNFSTDQILKKLLPAGIEAQTAFETIGHIAHLNLRDECLPYKHLIGQVILDKNPHLRTVVNKVGQIENEFRVFQMEVIAGETSFVTEMVQCGVKFRLDFSKVYWNSRLETEHKRLVALFKPSDVILDVMAGVGPFAVPAGKAGCTVYANDLNPDSVNFLKENIRLNKVGQCVHAFNMDGRHFIRHLLDPAACPLPPGSDANPKSNDMPKSNHESQPAANGAAAPPTGVFPTHVIMNLPASAVEFLDAFRGAFPGAQWQDRPLPLVHCYTFKKATETEEDVVMRVEHYLGGKLDSTPQIHTVRSVAPGKLMYCVSFHVPKQLALQGEDLAITSSMPSPTQPGEVSLADGQQTDTFENATSSEGTASKRQKLAVNAIRDVGP